VPGPSDFCVFGTTFSISTTKTIWENFGILEFWNFFLSRIDKFCLIFGEKKKKTQALWKKPQFKKFVWGGGGDLFF
jgi:hypothetical protein